MLADRHVTLAHPDPEVRRILRDLLSDAGLRPEIAADRDELRLRVTTEATDLVLLSIDPESEEDLGFLESLRIGPLSSDVPVIALLERDSERTVAAVLERGADDFLIAPVRGPEMIARMRSQLRLRAYTKELAHEKHDAQVMLELTQALASSLDFREILYTVVRRIAEVIQVSRVSVVLAPEPEQGDVGYVVVASDDEQLSNLRLDLTKYPEIQQVLRSRQSLTIRDATTHPVLDGIREDAQLGELSTMSLFPIVWEDRAIGVLFLRARAQRGVLSDREAHFCQIVANATAVALRNARVMQSLRDHTQQITFARFEAERRLRVLKRYADLFASAAEGIAAVDREGRVLFANPRAYEVIGRPEDTVTGKRLMTLLHPAERSKAKDLWEGFALGEYPRGIDLRVVRGSGDTIICSCSFAALVDGEGAVLISFQDVTEQRRTEAELVKTMEFLESLVDASVDGIIAADMEGIIILFNPSAERIYGYRAEEVIGRMSARELYPGEGGRDVMRRLRAPEYGGVGRLEPAVFEAKDREGNVFPIQISAAIIYEHGEPAATFGIFTDLREKLRFEERLAEAQEKLAMTEKQALIAELAGTAAHELNQPLTSIMAYAELLKRKLPKNTSESRAADVMVQEAERMAEIVRKIGTITRYETKSYVGEQKILDLDKASEAEGSPQANGDG
ncbi:MAG: PAS domain S-box protein [Polyangiaceae bacterium]|nr:PAS domain S-box protein [Polyangiaceae bacterium]